MKAIELIKELLFIDRRGKVRVKCNRGLTLVEMLIAVALVAIVASLGYMFYFTGFRAFDRNIDRADLQQNVRHSVSFISKRLLNASDADVIVTTITGAPDELIIGRELFRLAGTTLFINHDRFNTQSPLNPFADGITGFEVSRAGRMITITITAGGFDLSAQVLLRR